MKSAFNRFRPVVASTEQTTVPAPSAGPGTISGAGLIPPAALGPPEPSVPQAPLPPETVLPREPTLPTEPVVEQAKDDVPAEYWMKGGALVTREAEKLVIDLAPKKRPEGQERRTGLNIELVTPGGVLYLALASKPDVQAAGSEETKATDALEGGGGDEDMSVSGEAAASDSGG